MALNFVTVGAARATFTVPSNCRFGTGTYEGDLKSSGTDSSWSTITGPDHIDHVDVEMLNRVAEAYANSSVATAHADLQIQDDGTFVGHGTHQFTGNHFDVQGNFGDCVMNGTWKLTIVQADNKDYPKDTVLQGTFQINGAGSGGGGSSGGGSSSGACGVFGAGSLMMTFLGTAGLGRPLRRRRAVRRSLANHGVS